MAVSSQVEWVEKSDPDSNYKDNRNVKEIKFVGSMNILY